VLVHFNHKSEQLQNKDEHGLVLQVRFKELWYKTNTHPTFIYSAVHLPVVAVEKKEAALVLEEHTLLY
jgi:hypothetical protein